MRARRSEVGAVEGGVGSRARYEDVLAARAPGKEKRGGGRGEK